MWEYTTARWWFLGPEVDEWPEGERYSALLDEQVRVEDEERERARGSANWLAGIAATSDVVWRHYLKGKEGDELRARYREWRDTAERDALNEYGAAGFELVSVIRQEVTELDRGRFTVLLAEPEIQVYCYFKRQRFADAPPPPVIGFQPPGARPASAFEGPGT